MLTFVLDATRPVDIKNAWVRIKPECSKEYAGKHFAEREGRSVDWVDIELRVIGEDLQCYQLALVIGSPRKLHVDKNDVDFVPAPYELGKRAADVEARKRLVAH